MNNQQILRAYSIKEVSKKINIPTGTIRQWEKDLKGLLVIPRTQQGARYYTDNEIMLLNKIKEMRSQNVGKGMIRTLLEKSINEQQEDPSESFETSVQPVENKRSLELVKTKQESSMQEFHAVMNNYKQELLREISNELTLNRNTVVAEVKDEISTAFLQTISEVSKSIQRSNDKRKAEVHEITGVIMNTSEHTSEAFATLSKEVVKHSEAGYERLSKQLEKSTISVGKTSNDALKKVSETVEKAQHDIRSTVESLGSNQQVLMESLNELRQSTKEIRQREESFQEMIRGYRQAAAAAKPKKKWWQIWL